MPRLFVYHVEGYQKRGIEAGGEMDLLFRHQERLLLKAIMGPACAATWIFGLALTMTPGIVDWAMLWPWFKTFAVIAMTGFHIWLSRRHRDFCAGRNQWTGRQFRIGNEIPTVLMLIIVVSVVVKF
jgi:putative membrane protein